MAVEHTEMAGAVELSLIPHPSRKTKARWMGLHLWYRNAMLAPVLTLAMMQKQVPSALYLFNTCQAAIRMMEASKADLRELPGGNYCIGYIEGFMDGSGTIKRGACVPESADAEAIIRAYVAYLIKKPDEKQWDKRAVLLFALADAYPCSAK